MPEQALWQQILLTAMEDALIPENSEKNIMLKYQALQWVGTRDFKLICELAGIEQGSVENAFNLIKNDNELYIARLRKLLQTKTRYRQTKKISVQLLLL